MCFFNIQISSNAGWNFSGLLTTLSTLHLKGAISYVKAKSYQFTQ